MGGEAPGGRRHKTTPLRHSGWDSPSYLLFWRPARGSDSALERGKVGLSSGFPGVATPATSVTSLLVSYGLLGAKFVIFEFFAVITLGLVMGLVGNAAKSKAKVVVPPAQQALDPVCGMNVEVGKATEAEYRGGRIIFAVPIASKPLKIARRNIWEALDTFLTESNTCSNMPLWILSKILGHG